ncbi:MAG: serine/threonine protein kinase [Polyangiaceae bacterium]|nr:serine/threonine protein kinase [Polyangiaceae bacterium]
MRPNPGQVVGGKYRIVRLIGDGGMGAVFEARHEVLGSVVALKFLHAELARRTGLAARFLQEARVSASIQSPHVTRVIDVDQTPDGAPFIVMELLAGESLQQLLDRKLKLPRDQAVDFALQILCGLEAAHALGVVHRDLKPDNVFITPSGGGPVLKLLDFGIAKLRQAHEYQRGLTRPGVVMGTPEYMAPEQLYAADRVDHRADIYSLGAMLYEVLSGERPAYGDSAPEIIAKVTEGQVKPLLELLPDLPPGLAAAVHRAIEPDADRRYANAMEMRLDLARFAGQLSHAGQLAATPAPVAAAVAVTPAASDMAAGVVPHPPATPELAVRGVAPTLPPEEISPPAKLDPTVDSKGSTQDVPGEELRRSIAMGAAQFLPAPTVGTAPAFLPIAPIRRRRSDRLASAIGALLLGILVTGAIIAAVVLLRAGPKEDEPRFPSDGPPPAVTLSAQGVGTGGVPPDGSTTGAPVAPAPSPSPDPVGTRGTSSDAGADGGPRFPFPLPSSLPSTLPPLPPFPSTLPPFPSTLPPFPSTLPPFPSTLPPFSLPFPP